MQHTGTAVLSLLVLTSCSRPVGVDPRLSARERDDLQRAMKRPPVDEKGSHETVTADVTLPVSRAELVAWFERGGRSAWSEARSVSSRVPGVARTEPLTATFTEVGDRRRVVYADGNTAVEELVASGPEEVVRYEVWNDTRSIARYWTYSVGELAFVPRGTETQVRWTCRFRPKGWPDGYLIDDYVHRDYRDFMQATLRAFATRASSEASVR